MVSVIEQHAGTGAQIAVDQLSYLGYKSLEVAGIRIENGQEVMELARKIKGPDQLNSGLLTTALCRSWP